VAPLLAVTNSAACTLCFASAASRAALRSPGLRRGVIASEGPSSKVTATDWANAHCAASSAHTANRREANEGTMAMDVLDDVTGYRTLAPAFP
jgi:hypothetical protein